MSLALPVALEKQIYSDLGLPNETVWITHKGSRKRATVNKETLV